MKIRIIRFNMRRKLKLKHLKKIEMKIKSIESGKLKKPEADPFKTVLVRLKRNNNGSRRTMRKSKSMPSRTSRTQCINLKHHPFTMQEWSELKFLLGLEGTPISEFVAGSLYTKLLALRRKYRGMRFERHVK